MAYLSLIVKGDKFQAARAAADRGIGFAFVRQVDGEIASETVGKASPELRDKVAARQYLVKSSFLVQHKRVRRVGLRWAVRNFWSEFKNI